MARDVITVDHDYSVKYAARMMNYFGISSLIAVSEGDIVGILTEKDVLTRVVAAGLNPEKVLVKDVLTKPVIVVGPNTPLDEAVEIMFKRHIKNLPVVTKEDNNSKLVGMLSLTDIAKLQPKMFEAMRELAQMGLNTSEMDVSYYVR
jgi:CBS domain-containing protein